MLFVLTPRSMTNLDLLDREVYVLDTDDLTMERSTRQDITNYIHNGMNFINTEPSKDGYVTYWLTVGEYIAKHPHEVLRCLDGRVVYKYDNVFMFNGNRTCQFRYTRRLGDFYFYFGGSAFAKAKIHTTITSIYLMYLYRVQNYLITRFVCNVSVGINILFTLILDMDGNIIDVFFDCPDRVEIESRVKSKDAIFSGKFSTILGRRI